MEQSELDRRFKFLGYGFPQSLLWFVGIEEGGAQADKPMQQHHSFVFKNEKDLLYNDIPTEPNRVWDVSKKLASFARKYKYFMSNIAPLPRAKETMKLRGIENAKEYQTRVIEERVKRLVSIHRDDPKRVTVFHGAGARKRYKVLDAFDLNVNDAQHVELGLIIYEEKRLIFTHNFSHGYSFPNSNVEYVGNLLNKWLPGEPS